MTLRDFTAILYPVLAATALLQSGMTFLFWRIRRPTDVVIALGIYFFTVFITFSILAFQVGGNRVGHSEWFPYMIVSSRVLMLMSMWFHMWQYWRRMREDNAIEKRDRGSPSDPRS